MRLKSVFILLILILILLHGCAVPPKPVCEKNGQIYCDIKGSDTGQWYNHYKRALSCTEGGCYEHSVRYLKKALKKRPDEKKWASTFGMHYIDYFPHRETGIAYYYLCDYDAARAELELSVSLEPSAKAFFYLDKVRRSIMERDKWEISKPELEIHYSLLNGTFSTPGRKTCEIRTRDYPVIVSGTAEDRQYVSEITLAGRPVFMEVSEQQVAFSEKFYLNQGIHKIEIVARNLMGGEEQRELIIHVDRSGPIITIEDFQAGKIQGYVGDKAGVTSLTFHADGKAEDIQTDEHGFFVISFVPAVSASLVAVDELGNTTSAELAADVTANMGEFIFPFLAAANESSDFSTDAGSAMFADSATLPEITLKGWPEQETVFRKNTGIQGQVTGNNNITELSIEINGKQFNLLDKPGRIISFNQSVSLEEGINTVTVRAGDEYNRTVIEEIIVIRKIPEILNLKHRYTLKMYPADDTEWEKDLGKIKSFFIKIPVAWDRLQIMGEKKRLMFQHYFLESLVNQNRFQIILQEDLEKILSDNNLHFSEMNPAPGHNELNTFHALVLLNTCEDRNGIEISVRFVNRKTSEIMTVINVDTMDVYYDRKDSSGLKKMAEKLAEKITREFPMIQARLTVKTGENFIAVQEKFCPDEPLTDKKAVRIGWPFIIYREKEQRHNPVTAMSLGSDTEIIGHARVDRLRKNTLIFECKITTGPKDRIKTDDKVITR